MYAELKLQRNDKSAIMQSKFFKKRSQTFKLKEFIQRVKLFFASLVG